MYYRHKYFAPSRNVLDALFKQLPFHVFRLLLLRPLIIINIIIFLSFFVRSRIVSLFFFFFVSLRLRDFPLIYCIIVFVPRSIYLSSVFLRSREKKRDISKDLDKNAARLNLGI